MIKLVQAVFFVVCFLGVSCGSTKEPDLCRGCAEKYPYYNDSHLSTSVQKIETLPYSQLQVSKLGDLKKVFVFPVTNRRYTAVGFAHDFLSALEKEGWVVLDSDTQIRSADPLVDIERATGIKDPDIVGFYMTDYSDKSCYFYHTWKLLPSAKFLKVAVLEDFNRKIQTDNAAYFSQYADILLVRYPEAFKEVIRDCKLPVFHFPHSAGPAYFLQNTEFRTKKPKILLSGTISKEWYPLRSKALELFNLKNDFITLRKHPGYMPGIDPVEEANSYASSIAKHQLALTGAGMGTVLPAPYILGKHFEIPATGTVMVTDRLVAPMMERLGFIEGIHYLASTPNTLETDISNWLQPENLENLEKIGLAGHQLVKERHTLAKRVKEFEKVVYHAWKKQQVL